MPGWLSQRSTQLLILGFKAHTGCRDYLKVKSLKKKKRWLANRAVWQEQSEQGRQRQKMRSDREEGPKDGVPYRPEFLLSEKWKANEGCWAEWLMCWKNTGGLCVENCTRRDVSRKASYVCKFRDLGKGWWWPGLWGRSENHERRADPEYILKGEPPKFPDWIRSVAWKKKS